MAMSRNRLTEANTSDGAGAPGGALERLLETERALTERLAEADREAELLMEEARRTIAARESAFDHEVAAELTDLEARERAAVDAAIAGITGQAALEVARFDGVTTDRVAQLADAILARLLFASGGPGEDPEQS
jgi:hypothetical protein